MTVCGVNDRYVDRPRQRRVIEPPILLKGSTVGDSACVDWLDYGVASATATSSVVGKRACAPSLATGGVLMLTILPEANQEADGAIDEGFAMISLL